MKKKLLQFGIAASIVAVGLGVLVGVKSANTFIQKTDADNNYQLVLDQTNSPEISVNAKFDADSVFVTDRGTQLHFACEYVHKGEHGFYQTGGSNTRSKFTTTSPIRGMKKVIVNASFAADAEGFGFYYSNDADFATRTYVKIAKTQDAATDYEINFDFPADYFRIEGSNAWAVIYFESITIQYSCESTTDNLPVHKVNRNNNVYAATSLDGSGYSNFDGSYYYFPTKSNAAIVSVTLNLIDHDVRAWSGITITNDELRDPAGTVRNFKSVQYGLSKNGIYKAGNHIGEKLRDYSYGLLGGTATPGVTKLTIVFKAGVFHLYLDDTFLCNIGITGTDVCVGFGANDNLRFGVWFSNYFNANRTVTVNSEIYGADAVAAEIATNDVYANLR